MRRAALLALAALALLSGAAVAATPRTTLNDVEDELMCDTCNVPLNIANSERADEQRAEIAELIDRGLTKQQILDRFAAEYGPNVLASPKGGGGAITVWAVPAAVVAGVAVALLALLPRWRRRRGRSDGDADRPAALAPEDAARLERDLAAYDL